MATNTTTTNTPVNPWKAKELGVLWKKVKAGTTDAYLTGTINLKSLGFDKDVPVIVFPNKRKSSENQPDLQIYISEDRKSSSARTTPTSKAAPKTTVQSTDTASDLI